MLSRLVKWAVPAVVFVACGTMNAGAVSLFSTDPNFLPSPVVNIAPTSGSYEFITPPPNSTDGHNRSPFEDFTTHTVPAAYNNTPYYSVFNGTAVYDFVGGAKALALLWGSPDTYNTLTFWSGLGGTGTNLGSFTGSSLGQPLSFGHVWATFLSSGLADVFYSVTLTTTDPAFEYANLTPSPPGIGGEVPLPPAAILFGSALVGLALLKRRRSRRAVEFTAA